MNIKGKVVTLRALEMQDLPLLTKWSNSPEIWYSLGGWHFPYSSLSTEEYIKNINNKLTKIIKHAKRNFWLNDICTCHGLLPSHSA